MILRWKYLIKKPTNLLKLTALLTNEQEKKTYCPDSKLITKYEVGQKYTLSLDAEGYDNSIVELRYNKFER